MTIPWLWEIQKKKQRDEKKTAEKEKYELVDSMCNVPTTPVLIGDF